MRGLFIYQVIIILLTINESTQVELLPEGSFCRLSLDCLSICCHDYLCQTSFTCQMMDVLEKEELDYNCEANRQCTTECCLKGICNSKSSCFDLFELPTILSILLALLILIALFIVIYLVRRKQTQEYQNEDLSKEEQIIMPIKVRYNLDHPKTKKGRPQISSDEEIEESEEIPVRIATPPPPPTPPRTATPPPPKPDTPPEPRSASESEQDYMPYSMGKRLPIETSSIADRYHDAEVGDSITHGGLDLQKPSLFTSDIKKANSSRPGSILPVIGVNSREEYTKEGNRMGTTSTAGRNLTAGNKNLEDAMKRQMNKYKNMSKTTRKEDENEDNIKM